MPENPGPRLFLPKHYPLLSLSLCFIHTNAYDQVGALDKLPAFCSSHGAAFYGLPPPVGCPDVILARGSAPVPEAYAFGPEPLVPLRAGAEVGWVIEGRERGGVGPACI